MTTISERDLPLYPFIITLFTGTVCSSMIGPYMAFYCRRPWPFAIGDQSLRWDGNGPGYFLYPHLRAVAGCGKSTIPPHRRRTGRVYSCNIRFVPRSDFRSLADVWRAWFRPEQQRSRDHVQLGKSGRGTAQNPAWAFQRFDAGNHINGMDDRACNSFSRIRAIRRGFRIQARTGIGVMLGPDVVESHPERPDTEP